MKEIRILLPISGLFFRSKIFMNKIIIFISTIGVIIAYASENYEYPTIEDRIGWALKSDSVSNRVRILRNEIFAKHGRKFNSPDLDKYFTKQDWYNINKNYHDSLLTNDEKKLIDEFIKLENFFKGTNKNKEVFKLSREREFESDQFIDPTETYGINILFENTSIGKLLIFERFSHKTAGNFEGTISNSELRVYLVNSDRKLEEKWKSNFAVNDISVYGDFLITSIYGCCGSPDESKVYNLCTGKLITNFTMDYLIFSNELKDQQRMLCFSEIFNSPLRSKLEDDKKVLGFLQLVNPDTIVDNIIVSVEKDTSYKFDICEPTIEQSTEVIKNKKDYNLNNNELVDIALDCYFQKVKIPISINKIIIEELKNPYLGFRRFR